MKTIHFPQWFLPVLVAAILWLLMFSGWIAWLPNFWLMMSLSALILSGFVLRRSPETFREFRTQFNFRMCGLGIGIAAILWAAFWVGDKLAAWLFAFARPQIATIYTMGDGTPAAVIAILLLLLIGPAEEFFWRGFVQRSLCQQVKPLAAFIITLALYTLIHVWAGNFMLLAAAAVAGAAWGGLYLWRPQWLPALVISHALWDCAVFVLFPI